MKQNYWSMLALSLSILTCLLLLPLPDGQSDVLADENRPSGEIPFAGVKDERPQYMRLLSGKLFRVPGKRGKYSETSVDGGKTWQKGGQIVPFYIGLRLRNTEIQFQSGPHKGRIMIPYYLEMDGGHPDYDSKERGGYAIFKGKKIRVEGHTHVPEMAGSFVCYSDDEGKTWKTNIKRSQGFMMGYIKDGHLGHWSCEEPVVAELKDGRILCFMRSTCGRILKSYSEDGGEHWMKVQPTDIAMSNSPCALKRIPGTGDLVMVWNMMSAEEIRTGYRRGRLSIAISKDDGQTWENVKTLELTPGLEDHKWVEPPPLQPMVRGPSGIDNPMGEIPDDFIRYHYSSIFLSEDKIFIEYSVSPLGGVTKRRSRVFPISWLYQPEPNSDNTKKVNHVIPYTGYFRFANNTSYIQIPDDYEPHEKYPLIIFLHGRGVDARTSKVNVVTKDYDLFREKAKNRGFILAAPLYGAVTPVKLQTAAIISG